MIFEIVETTTIITTKQIEANSALEAEEKAKNNDQVTTVVRRQTNVNIQEKEKIIVQNKQPIGSINRPIIKPNPQRPIN